MLKKLLKNVIYAVNRRVQKLRTAPVAFITCCGNADGAGAQAHAVISTILYARLYGLNYLHTPFTRIDHKPASSPDWENKWEEFFNLGDGEATATGIGGNKRIALKHPLLLWKKSSVVYTVRNCHEATDVQVDEYAGIQEDIKTKFFASEKNLPEQNTEQDIRIALHIRRGDVSQSQNTERFTPFHQLLTVLNEITHVLRENNLSFKVDLYSQGNPDQFQEWKNHQVSLHLNEDECSSFLGLVTADVLVMAKSSYSYMAAYLSNAFVLYDEFWHPPLSTWTSINDEAPVLQRKLNDFLTKRKNNRDQKLTILKRENQIPKTC